jgi:hypothetical protein
MLWPIRPVIANARGWCHAGDERISADRQPRFACLVLLLVAVGCTRSETLTFQDEGKICVWPEGVEGSHSFGSKTPFSFAAGEVLQISVVMPTCLSSSCSKDPEASCEVKLAENLLSVTSTGAYRDEGRTCTGDCGFLVARCVSPVLAAGTYTIRHGTDELVLGVPSTTNLTCAGRAP